MAKFYNIPEDLVQRYPDAGVYEFWDGDAVAPLVVTKDPDAMKLGALAVYEVDGLLRCGLVVDLRGGFSIMEDVFGDGVSEVPERDLLGVSVGLVTRYGVVTD